MYETETNLPLEGNTYYCRVVFIYIIYTSIKGLTQEVVFASFLGVLRPSKLTNTTGGVHSGGGVNYGERVAGDGRSSVVVGGWWMGEWESTL